MQTCASLIRRARTIVPRTASSCVRNHTHTRQTTGRVRLPYALQGASRGIATLSETVTPQPPAATIGAHQQVRKSHALALQQDDYELPDIMKIDGAVPNIPPAMRTLLFVPAHAMAKGVASGPDAIVLDMEDAIAFHKKKEVRAATKATILRLYEERTTQDADAQPVFVRINSLEHMKELEADIHELVADLPPGALHGLMLPKVRHVQDMEAFERLVVHAERHAGISQGHGLRFLPLIETASGLMNAADIASYSPRNLALVLGHADLTTDLKATPSEEMLLHARSVVVAAARSAGISPIDTPCFTLDDKIAMEADSKTARSLGFDGKLVLHPSQVAITQLAFLPSSQEVKWAEGVLGGLKCTAAPVPTAGAVSSDGTALPSVCVVDGVLAGPPMLAKARSIVQRMRRPVRRTSNASGVAKPVLPVLPSYGLNLSTVHEGQTIESPLEITITDAFKTTWMSSFFEPARLFTSDAAAGAMGLQRGSPVPWTIPATLSITMSIIKFSENAIVYLGMHNVKMTRPVHVGDTLRNTVKILAYRNTRCGKASVVTSRHELVDNTGAVVCSSVKNTMFKPIPGLGKGESVGTVEPVESATNAWMAAPAADGPFGWMLRVKRNIVDDMRPPFELKAGLTMVHRVVKIFGDAEHRTLINLMRVTNAHNQNTLQFTPSQLLIAGPIAISGVLSNAGQDLGVPLAEMIHSTQQINKLNVHDVLVSATHVVSVEPAPWNPELEVVRAITYGIKNIDTYDLLRIGLPPAMFESPDAVLTPKEFEEQCLSTCPQLYHKVVARIHRTFVRPRPSEVKDAADVRLVAAE